MIQERVIPRKSDPARNFVVERQFIKHLRVIGMLTVDEFRNLNRTFDGTARCTGIPVCSQLMSDKPIALGQCKAIIPVLRQ